MCQHRFGVINRIYQELMCEGYTDLVGSGIAATNHLADWVQGKQECMFNFCDGVYPEHDYIDAPEGTRATRILPWSHDYNAQCESGSPNEYNQCSGLTEQVNENHCGDDGFCENLNVWQGQDVLIRDLFIIDKEGNVRLRINLTPNNPQKGAGCGDTYNLIKQTIKNAHGAPNGVTEDFKQWIIENYPNWACWCSGARGNYPGYTEDEDPIIGWDNTGLDCPTVN